MTLRSVRGATTVENNSREEILLNTSEMLGEIISINNIKLENIISIIFSCTRDLTKVYPAVAAREIGIVNASLMCFDELYVEGSLEKCIRVMVSAEMDVSQKDVKHVYLNEAKKLRPDLAQQ